MTTQTKKFIEPWDIIGVQMQCKKCSASRLVSGDTLRTLSDPHNDALWKCSTCSNSWTVPQTYPTQTTLDTQVKQFIRMVARIQAIDEQLGFHIRFEIRIARENKSINTNNS